MIAVSAGRLDIAKVLIKKCADVNHANINGQVCLHYAASKNLPEIAELLLDNGADVNVRDKMGSTPLHRAASRGHNNIVKQLLAVSHVQVDCVDSTGSTPL